MKLQLISLLIVVTGLQAFAGDNTRSGIGFKGGLVLSTAGYPEESASNQKNRMKPGGFGGLCYERQFGNVIAFELEVLYANLGVRERSDLPLGATSKLIRNYHTMQLPLNLKFYIGDNFNLYVGGYGQYMFAMRDRLIIEDADGEVVLDEKSDNVLRDNTLNPEDADGDKLIMPWDAGVQGGVEFISNMGLGVGARFQKGLIDITNDKFNGLLQDDKWVTNTALQIYLVGHF